VTLFGLYSHISLSPTKFAMTSVLFLNLYFGLILANEILNFTHIIV